MGCDIHMRAEVRTENKWQIVGRLFKNPYYKNGSGWGKEKTESPYDGRNYNLFAILADVRNGHGFAGIKTGDGFNPIDEPRGVPQDASVEAVEFLNQYGSDGHSHSHFTLKELQEYDWNQLTVQQGWVKPEEYKSFVKDGKPESWCGGVSGGAVKHISNKEMETAVDTEQAHNYTLVKWGTTYRDAVGKWWFESVEELAKLGAPEDVRIVFFFDN